MAAAPSSEVPTGGYGSRREAAVLLLTTLGTVMVAVDSTIVILALPTMRADLHSSFATIIWTILLYLLVTAALTTQAGRVGDLLGRGRVYNAGFAIFTVGSALCGFAPTDLFLIGARVVQAVGGAIMFANAGALIAHVFPPERRGRAFGYLVFGWSVGAILGILLGGVITTTLGWRYNFFINLPIGLVAIVLGLRSLPATGRTQVSLDLPGFVVFSMMLGAICYGAIELAVSGPALANELILAVGLALLPVFVLIESRARQPMLDLHELRRRLLGLSLIAGFLQALGSLSVIFLLTLYLQGIRGLSPLDSSVLLVPGYLVGAAAGPLTGRYVDRIGPRGLATAGLLVTFAAVLAYSRLATDTYLGWIPVVSGVSGVGTGMFFPANNTAIMGEASPRSFGAISGLRATLTNMGTLLSFVVSILIASSSVGRTVAYEVFLGTSSNVLAGGAFLGGIHAALYGSAAILALAAVLSWSRGAKRSASAAGVGTQAAPGVANDPPVVEGERRGSAQR